MTGTRNHRRYSHLIFMQLTSIFCCTTFGCLLATAGAAPPSASQLSRSIDQLLAVTSGSQQDDAARRAWQLVQQASADQLADVLHALDRASPLAGNWINMALDAVVGRVEAVQQAKCRQLLAETAEATDHTLLTRRTAIDLLSRLDPQQAQQVQDRLINDPESSLRRPAIAAAIRRLTRDNSSTTSIRPAADRQLAEWNHLFDVARDEDQVTQIAQQMKRLGAAPDLAAKFGYVIPWQVIGPFDNTDGRGFGAAYPPESLQLNTWMEMRTALQRHQMPGKSGPVSWRPAMAKSINGDVDLNQVIEKLRDVVGYGVTTVRAKQTTDAEIRLRVQNAFTIWLNGKLLLSQPVGHTGNTFDMYRVPAHLQAGENLIVIKSCQVDIKGVSFFDRW